MLKITRDTKTRGQKITFTLPADHPAGAISVVGNFNDWTPGANPLVKRGKSQSTSVVVPADYISVFRYLGENGQWFDEPEASYVDEGASVVVPQAKPAPRTRKPAAKKVAEKSATKKVAEKVAEKVTEVVEAVEDAAQAVEEKVAPKKAPAKRATKASKAPRATTVKKAAAKDAA